jgi:hypothetical protein
MRARTSALAGSVGRIRRRPIPRLIICAGLKSSGSTWLYNVVAEILKTSKKNSGGERPPPARGFKILQFYADSVAAFPPQAACASGLLVKSHIPDDSLNVLVTFGHACLFLTVREPRDSIVSAIQRFGHSFDKALEELGTSSARLAALPNRFDPHVLRYEDRFFEEPRTISQIARILGLPLDPAIAGRIFDRHTRAAVTKRIRALEKRGVFGKVPDPDRFDPASHWHPGHIGDAESGKFAAVLSPAQQRAVLSATSEFRRAFGYSK